MASATLPSKQSLINNEEAELARLLSIDITNYYRRIDKVMTMGVAVLTPHFRIVGMNRQMTRWFPEVDSRLHPLCHRSFVFPPSKEVCPDCPAVYTLADGKSHEAVMKIPGEGPCRYFRIVTSAFLDENEEIIGVVEVVEDYTEKIVSQKALEERDRKFRKKAKQLREMNAALKVLLKQRSNDRVEIESNITANIRQLVQPYLEMIRQRVKGGEEKMLLNILSANFESIISPFARNLSSEALGLTPMEIRIAQMVRDGYTNKQIAGMAGVSVNTVLTHRFHIRKKLDIKNTGVNLRAHLMSLQRR